MTIEPHYGMVLRYARKFTYMLVAVDPFVNAEPCSAWHYVNLGLDGELDERGRILFPTTLTEWEVLEP